MKLESLEGHNTRLKAGNEDLLKQLSELNARNASLLTDEGETKSQLDKVGVSFSTTEAYILKSNPIYWSA